MQLSILTLKNMNKKGNVYSFFLFHLPDAVLHAAINSDVLILSFGRIAHQSQSNFKQSPFIP